MSPSTAAVYRRERLIDRLFDSAADRTEPLAELDPDVVEFVATDDSPELSVAVSLYQATRCEQRLDVAGAGIHLAAARTHLPLVTERRLRWWVQQTEANLALAEGDTVRCRAEYRSALALAEEFPVADDQRDRTLGNLLGALQLAGAADDVANLLVQALRGKQTTELGPVFYQQVADVLLWLHQAEWAYDFRRSAMELVRPSGGRLIRDERELARAAIALGRLSDARRHLDRAVSSSQHLTAEEDRLNRVVVAELALAEGNSAGAFEQLEELGDRALSASCATDIRVRLAASLVADGDFDGAHQQLSTIDLSTIRGDFLWWYYALGAEVAAVRHETARALEYYDHARELASRRLVSTEMLAIVRAELDPWLAVADPHFGAGSTVDRRRAFRSRWLTATARDIRRSMAPALLALRSDVGPEAKEAALRSAVDELTVISGFLADTGGPVATPASPDFWVLYEPVERIVARQGASLEVTPAVGTAVDLHRSGLAGRLAFGLISVVADQASSNTAIALRVSDGRLEIDASEMDDLAIQRVLSDMQQLRARSPIPGIRVLPRASFIATFNSASQLGWAVTTTSPRPGALVVEVDIAVREVEPESADAVKPDPTLPGLESGIAELAESGPVGMRLAEMHHRRAESIRPVVDLVQHAREVGDDDLIATALLVNGGAALYQGDMVLAEQLLEELNELVGSDSGLIERLSPGFHIFSNRQMILSEARGDGPAAWDWASRNVLIRAAAADSSLGWRYATYNWCRSEVNRGGLTAAWRLAGTCDPLGNNAAGRALELAIQTQVFLVEGRVDRALEVATERVELGPAVGAHQFRDALHLHTVAAARCGRFDLAWESLEELDTGPRLRYGAICDALRVRLLKGEGRYYEAEQALAKARAGLVGDLSTAAESVLVPIEAELRLNWGDAEKAGRVLDAFDINRHPLIDLAARLEIERRVREALGDETGQMEAAVQQLRMTCGERRFSVPTDMWFAVWDAFEQVAVHDRTRIDAEQAAVASVVAHDVRNVLSAIALDLGLSDGATSPRTDLAFSPIESMAARLDDVARFGESAKAERPEPIDIAQMLDATQHPSRELYERSGGRLVVELDVPSDLVVRANHNLLEIVLRNLIGNAVQHGRRGGIVRVSASFVSDAVEGSVRPQVCITIEDDGPGLAEEQLQRLQDPESASASAPSGMGLWIVRRYVNEIGADLRAGTSELGGARLDLFLPIGEPIIRRAAGPAAGVGPPRDLMGPRELVLVVEDDAILVELIATVLRTQGKSVVSADTAEQALWAIDIAAPDVVLSDIELADGSTGYDVFAGLRARSLNPSFIMMSGQSMAQMQAEALRICGEELQFLPKPFTLDALVDLVG